MRRRHGLSLGMALLLLAACAQAPQAPLPSSGDTDRVQAGSTIVVKDQASCEALAGDWFSTFSECRFYGPYSDLVVAADDVWDVRVSVSFSRLTNNGTFKLTNGAVFTASGIINNGVMIIECGGSIDPYNQGFSGNPVQDECAPDTSISGQPANPSNSNSASFTFGGSDNVTPAASLTFECKLDDGAFAACASPKSYSGLSGGSHTFQVRAKDAAGNQDQTPASYTWTVAPDTTPPSASPTLSGTLGSNGWYTSNVTINWNWSDAGSGIGTPCILSGVVVGDGSSTFTATCRDQAGNVGSASIEVKIDTTAPSITLASRLPAPNGAGWNNSDVTVTWNCTDATSGPVSATVSQVLTTEGDNLSATGTCADKAGKTASNTVSGIKIDRTRPTLSPAVSPNPVLRFLSAVATPNAADGLSGVASQSCPAVGTSSLGPQSVTCTATDNAGNTNTAPASYTVVSASSAISGLSSQVQGLPGLSGVNRTLLLTTLSGTRTLLSLGMRAQAASSMSSFVDQVNRIRNVSGGLTSAQADALIAQANLIIQSINAGG